LCNERKRDDTAHFFFQRSKRKGKENFNKKIRAIVIQEMLTNS
jgi:hypothetical protein